MPYKLTYKAVLRFYLNNLLFFITTIEKLLELYVSWVRSRRILPIAGENSRYEHTLRTRRDFFLLVFIYGPITSTVCALKTTDKK